MSSHPLVQIDQLPRSVADFVTLRDRIATSPQGGAAVMVVALLLYTQDEEFGQQCLAAAVDRGRLVKGSQGYQDQQLNARDMQLIRTQIAAHPYLPRSYVQGATPENGYRLPDPPYRFDFAYNPHSGNPDSGVYKPFVVCSGASSPRPVTMRRDSGGIWKAHEWSSLVVDIRPPAHQPEDDRGGDRIGR